MAIDARYQDNVVLKQDAFQNLLTNIKNYPIIDIDYISETDTDQLHGDTVWDHYTEGVPCIKITYGDERTTKGNIMFAEQYKNEIATKQNTLKIEGNTIHVNWDSIKGITVYRVYMKTLDLLLLFFVFLQVQVYVLYHKNKTI